MGIFIFGMFFFLTVFMQAVWGYSALKTGLAYLPFTAALFIGAGAVTQLVPRIGARPLLLAGSAPAPAACTGCPGSASTTPTPARCSARPWSSEPGPPCCSSRCPWSR